MDIIRVLPWLGYCPDSGIASHWNRCYRDIRRPSEWLALSKWCSLLGGNSSYFLCYGHRKEFTGSCWESPVVHSGKRSRRTVCVRQMYVDDDSLCNNLHPILILLYQGTNMTWSHNFTKNIHSESFSRVFFLSGTKKLLTGLRRLCPLSRVTFPERHSSRSSNTVLLVIISGSMNKWTNLP